MRGEISRYIHKLCSRCYTSDTIPLENSWFLLLGFRASDGTFLSGEEFLIRFNMSKNVATASKRNAEGVHSGKRIEKAILQKTADTIKAEFVQHGLQYLQCFIGEVLRQAGLNSNIIKRLAAFDPFIMFKRPIEVALRHFYLLYDTFLRRSWVTVANHVACRDEYVRLLEYLWANYSPDFVVTNLARDLIDYLINLEFLQSRRLLIYLFKLRCLCITTISPQYPSVTVGRIDTSGYCDRFTDVVLPSQSYLSAIPGSVSYCSSDAQLANFSLLTASFGQTAFSPDYDPWESVDQFGRSKIYNHCCLHTGKFSLGRKESLCRRKLERPPPLLISLP